MRLRHVRAITATLVRTLLLVVVVALVLAGVAAGLLESSWGKNQLRALIVRQANQYLAATLSIGTLEGSLFRGVRLGNISLSVDGQPVIAMDGVTVDYDPRELLQDGVVIRRVEIVRPRIVAARRSDGRWNLGALVRRDERQQGLSGPRRAVQIQAIEIQDATVLLRDPLEFGAVHVPTELTELNAAFSFRYDPVQWSLEFGRVSWVGRNPELSVERLTGGLAHRAAGWFFNGLSVTTARSAFVLDGGVLKDGRPTELDLRVRADRFAFQEWAGIIEGLKNLAVDAAFDTTLKGPLARLATTLTLNGTGGAVRGQLTLDTTVPGWHAAGALDLARLNLARWLNRPDRASDLTGRAAFDLDLDLGRRFPRGSYTFDGPHAMYMNYAADSLHAAGRVTATDVLIDEAKGMAYGAQLEVRNGTIGIEDPFPYRFDGSIANLDLRRVPASVPVPRVDSTLAFQFGVTGQFVRPSITGRAEFAESRYLGATIGAGTVGTIDTSVTPLHYAAEGEVAGVDVSRFGEGLDVAWLRDPRYAGTLSGRFRIDGTGGDRSTLRLAASGRVTEAAIFSGSVSDAGVSLDIDGGSLDASFDGRFAGIDPAAALADNRFSASLSGTGQVRTTVADLLTRTATTLADYRIDGRVSLTRSTVRGFDLDTAAVTGTLANGQLTLAELRVDAPAVTGTGSGVVALDHNGSSDFEYDVTRADLAGLQRLAGRAMSGIANASGHLSGPFSALQMTGEGAVRDLSAAGVNALSVSGQYDASGDVNKLSEMTAHVAGEAVFATVAGEKIDQLSGTATLTANRTDFDARFSAPFGRAGEMTGSVILNRQQRTAVVLGLTLDLGDMPWKLVAPSDISWTDAGIEISPATFTSGSSGDERIGISGTWRQDGMGALRITAAHVSLDTLAHVEPRPAEYGGILDVDAVVRGTRSAPIATGTIAITGGRVDRVTYQQLRGRVDYAADAFDIDLRLDQGPGVWLTARGAVPAALLDRTLPDRPIDLTVESSSVDLGLTEGITDVVNRVTGQLQLHVRVTGTARDPHLDGTVEVDAAGFLVAATGVQYKNGRAAIKLATDRVTVDSLHLEDSDGHSLELHGTLATRELQIGDFSVDGTAHDFTLLRNELGRLDVNASLHLGGRLAQPTLTGDVTVTGDTLRADEILERALFTPYATQPTAVEGPAAVAALNPWQRVGVDVSLHIPKTLRLTGSSVQVTSGTPIGFGDIDLRIGGDLYLYKGPGQPMSITGSLDSLNGRYAFQGRSFDVEQGTSSINFVGDLDPQIYVTVTRVISGVEAHVLLTGSVHQPVLALSSTPPLDQSDILSLIVFNAAPNSLSATQQQELAVRAGALAAGFLATPLVSALQRDLGLEAFELEPGDVGAGPKVTVGEELAPGLVARFSRQFGADPFDEAIVEYYLTSLLRLRATFSDAQSLTALSPFRRVERAGLDLLVFLSF